MEKGDNSPLLPYEVKFWEKKIVSRIARIKQRMNDPTFGLKYAKYQLHPLIKEPEVVVKKVKKVKKDGS